MSLGGAIGGAVGLGLAFAFAPATGGLSFAAGAAAFGLGMTAGGLAQNMISPPTIPGQTSEGPRLQDLKVQSASYGRPIPIILGKMRTAGNILWIKTGGLIEERVEQTSHSGGGKTGGGTSSTQVFYNYYATCAIAICKGPIKKVVKIWADSKLVYNAEATDTGTTQANTQFQNYVHGYLGDETQGPDSVIEADLGVGNVPAYRGLAYIVLERFPLKDYGNRIPNFTFKVVALVPTGSGAGEASQFVDVTVNNPLPATIKLALNFNGMNGANTDVDFVDSSQFHKSLFNSLVNGIASLSTAQKVFGSASGYFPFQESYLYTAADDDFNLSATAPWQISFRYRTNDPTQYHCLVCKRTGIAGNGLPSSASWNINIGNGVLIWGSDVNGNQTAQLDLSPIVANTWAAFRISHDGLGNIRFYKDGQILYSGAGGTGNKVFPIIAFTGYNQLKIGNNFLTGQTGGNIYLDDFIIQKGGTITVADTYTVETTETAPTQVTSSQLAGGLLEYPDYSGKNRYPVSVTGSPAGSSAQKVFGAASGLFAPGDAINFQNDSWQSLQNSGEWGIGFRILFKDAVASAVIMSTGGVTTDGWQLEYDNSLTYIYDGSGYANHPTLKFTHSSGTVLRFAVNPGYANPSANTWYAVGLSYSGGYLRCYVDGVYRASTKVALGAITNNANSNFVIGQAGGGTTSYYLDELIIQDTTGVFLQEADYPLPTSESIADSNTRLLLHFNQVFSAVGAGNWGNGLAYVDTKVSNIISYLCTQAGLTSTDFNTGYIALNDNAVVQGFVLNNVAPVRQALEMLAATFLLDMVESADKLYFFSRNSLINGGPAALIPETDLASRHITQSPPLPLQITTQQEIEIPKELRVRYLNPDQNYYEAVQRSVKQNTNSIGSAELNVTALALTDSQAKIAAIGNHMFAWGERKKYKFTLPMKYGYLDCGDMIQVNYSSQSHFIRITKMNYGPGYFDMEGVGQDFTGLPFNIAADGYSGPVTSGAFASIPATVTALVVSSTNTKGAESTQPPQTINYPVVSTLVLLDMAIISDSEDGAGYYVGIDKGASSNYWPGGVVYKSSDNFTFSTLLSFAAAMTTGQAINALADSQSYLWDGNTVTIALINGTLASDTQINVLNGANIGILGNEIIQWTTAVLDSNGNYVLSGLLRGRRGTEWATGTHAAGERFIAFNTASVQRAPGVNEEIGLSRYYRAVTVGLNLADQTSQNFTNTAKGLKPYSPCNITGSRDGSNNLTINWVRRTRTGGAWRDNVDISLGETLEQYDVDIMSGSTVLRSIIGLASPTASYTAAQQTADGLTPGNPVSVNIYQISSTVGRGYAGAKTI